MGAFDYFHGSDAYKPTAKQVPFAKVIDIKPYLRREERIRSDTFNFNGFKPLHYQADIWLDMAERPFIRKGMGVLPRRAGKSYFLVIYILIQALKKAYHTELPFLKYGLVYPDLVNGKEIGWDPLTHHARGLPGYMENRTEGRIRFNIISKHGRTVNVSCLLYTSPSPRD